MQLKRDLKDKSYEDLGFRTTDEASIDAEIESLKLEIDPEVKRRYEKISTKYDRPLVPIRRGVCYGCFVQFPTAKLSEFDDSSSPITCESCGRLLYQIP